MCFFSLWIYWAESLFDWFTVSNINSTQFKNLTVPYISSNINVIFWKIIIFIGYLLTQKIYINFFFSKGVLIVLIF